MFYRYLQILLSLIFFAVAACTLRRPSLEDQDVSSILAVPDNRKIMGIAHDYIPLKRVDSSLLRSSVAYRRKVGWSIVRKILAPVAITPTDFNNTPIVQLPNLPYSSAKTIPLWASWYSSEEFQEIFRSLYTKAHSKRGNKTANPKFTTEQISQAFKQHAIKKIFGWSAAEFNSRLSQIRSKEALQGLMAQGETKETSLPGISGSGMTLFSPGIIRHLLQNYQNIDVCITSEKDLDEVNPQGNCYGNPGKSNEFKNDAVMIKATWEKVPWNHENKQIQCGIYLDDPQSQFHNEGIVVYRSDASSIKQAIIDGTWSNQAPRLYRPCLSEIFTVETGSQDRYMLTGLHIAAKETSDWIWVSLWFAPSGDALKDFGSDRPKDLSDRLHSWRNYKMCVSASFEEEDTSPYTLLSPEMKEVQKAISKAHENLRVGGDKYTWCSNPYIEMGHGNSRTNCIGCHQHAGTEVNKDSSFKDEERFPFSGRSKLRKSFSTDYLWSLELPPDKFGRKIQRVIEQARINDIHTNQ